MKADKSAMGAINRPLRLRQAIFDGWDRKYSFVILSVNDASCCLARDPSLTLRMTNGRWDDKARG